MQVIADIRKEYKKQFLLEDEVDKNPFNQFSKWWAEVLNSELEEANAMTLATADATGNPSARIVLLKGYDDSGFVFFGNYHSQKGAELEQNPRASLVFFWKELERQVRILGTVNRIPAAESDAYFYSRPLESRMGAWASPQSKVIASRKTIEDNLAAVQQQYANGEVPRPPHWGGYKVTPKRMEFWQGRPSRLHDRILYSLGENGAWRIERLAP